MPQVIFVCFLKLHLSVSHISSVPLKLYSQKLPISVYTNELTKFLAASGNFIFDVDFSNCIEESFAKDTISNFFH